MAKNNPSQSRAFWLKTVFWLTLIYFATHLLALTRLPVFADEAIYIRWAQLIMDDAGRYLFFALNDGKTPLFIWSLVPFQYLFSDPLWAGRFVSVLVGYGQMIVLGLILKQFRLRREAIISGMVLAIILPFWYFYQRMALMDAMLTFWLSLAFLFLIKLNQHLTQKLSQPIIKKEPWIKWLTRSIKLAIDRKFFIWFFSFSLSLALALWTKLPAVLFIPGLFLWSLTQVKLNLFSAKIRLSLERLTLYWLLIGLAIIFALSLFFMLKWQPAFGQLFGRGEDFLFTPKQILFGGELRTVLHAWPRYWLALSYYLTPFGLLAPFFGLFFRRHRRIQLILFLSGLSFIGPILLFGRVVYPRYFLPLALFATISYAVLLDDLLRLIQRLKSLNKKILVALTLALILANTLTPSLFFMFRALTSVNQLPLTPVDRQQYLTAWSAGQGIKEVSQKLLKEKNVHNRIALATEGYFGTLPDGILMYLHRRNVTNLLVEGIGQPVRSLPSRFLDRAKSYDRVWLLVNSNRLKMSLPKKDLLLSFCRPRNPKLAQQKCLELWDIKSLTY